MVRLSRVTIGTAIIGSTDVATLRGFELVLAAVTAVTTLRLCSRRRWTITSPRRLILPPGRLGSGLLRLNRRWARARTGEGDHARVDCITHTRCFLFGV